MKTDDPLDRLFAAARADVPDTSALEFGFETRLLARLRQDRSPAWFSWAWRLSPYFAALALAAGAWGYFRGAGLPDGESLVATIREGGLPALQFYLSPTE